VTHGGSATIHLVEPGGAGGIHQHAAALADGLAEGGVTVVLHTASDAEELALPTGVSRRPCFWRFADVSNRSLRRLAIVGAWLGAGIPGCLMRTRPGDVVHVEGRFFPVLLLPLFVGARLRRCRIGFSPHTTFPRARRGQEPLVRWMARRADVVFAFSHYDQAVMVKDWGVEAVRVPLAMGRWAEEPDPGLVEGWRQRWRAAGGGDRPVVLFAGQLRPDKGLDLAVQAAEHWRRDALLAVVGEDHGALARAIREAAARGVDLVVGEGYHPLPQMVAAVAAADVVLCPYRAASMSGVLALATALGRPTVATDVGGSAEVATVAVPPDDPGALAAGVDKALDLGRPGERPAVSWPSRTEVARTVLAAYGLTAGS
jgi:glycosyltransferase involved in cell wall biosynthesis